MKNKTILVAGAAGFIGSYLCEHFLQEGNYVIGVDNLVTGSMANINLLSKYDNFKFIDKDISEKFEINQKIDEIYDFACPASPIDFVRLRIEILKVSSIGLYNMLELARENNSRFIYASSSEVYGDPEKNPQSEDYNGNVNTIGVRSVYDEGKRFGESMVMAFHREYKLDTKIVRIFNTYGPRMRVNDGRAIPTFINQAVRNDDITIFGEGYQTRSPQYITDLVNGVLLLSKSDVNEPVNIGNPEEITMVDLATKIIDLAKSESKFVYKPLPEHDPKVRKPDIKKAMRLLEWEPKIALETGLTKTIDWFRKKS